MNELMGVLILTTAISATNAGADDAAKAIFKASYKYTQTDKMVKNLEKRYIPKELKRRGTYLLIAGRLATEGKISYEWSF